MSRKDIWHDLPAESFFDTRKTNEHLTRIVRRVGRIR
jgi:hypothetical protein